MYVVFENIMWDFFAYIFNSQNVVLSPVSLAFPPVGGNSTYFLLGCEPAKIRSLTN